MNDQPTNPAAATRATREQVESRIEEVRGMLRVGLSTGEVRRRLRDKYGLSRRSMNRYLAHARKRNRGVVEKTEDQALADSVNGWRGLLMDELARAQRAAKLLADQEARIERIDALLSDPGISPESYAAGVSEKTVAAKIIDSARRTLFTCRKFEIEIRDRMDRLFGTYAPRKVAQTTASGKDVFQPARHYPEPLTDEEGEQQLLDLVERLKERGCTMDETLPVGNPRPSSPSSNGHHP